MELDYNLLNILILFGAIQGLILCIFLYQKRKMNTLAVDFFILFLLSLSFYNLMYAFLDMELFRYNRSLHVFPYPYKWLIAVGFYFYVKNQFKPANGRSYHGSEWYLFIPAGIYFLLRVYWFSIAVKEDSYRITKTVVDSDFFRIQEFFILAFNIVLLVHLLYFLDKKEAQIIRSTKTSTTVKWLRLFIWVFLVLTIGNLFTYSFDIIIHDGKETFAFLYPTLIANVLFIYWIGFMGFTKPNRFFNNFSLETSNNGFSVVISDKLRIAMEEDSVYKNPNLTLSLLASELEISTKELSKFINDHYHMNFSEYINHHRIETVKKLLTAEEAQKFKLVALAEIVGFNSKSSFNATFKKMTGMTPSEYKKSQNSN